MKDQPVSLSLPGSILQWIEQTRGQTERSVYIAQLLQQKIEQAQRETVDRAALLAEGRIQYTPAVCEQSLKINDEFPIHEE
ncbi:MAG TPA: hypothetical protein VJ063_18490 [Verrucomicrobiae bacterium]|nr:hypothetical protein [Verrucomicrobiae bacterium]